jgi:CBS domain containing-hemolysin-like protein
LPVYRERLDDVVGILFRRDLEPYLHQTTDSFDLESLLHPARFIPVTARLGAALRLMQSSRTHIAVVVDEHGGMEGIVTLEDLLEEIVGEINDEFDEEVRSQITKEHGAYVLSGMLTVRDANRQLKLGLPEDEGYTTLAGFMQAQAGRLLQEGETVDYEGRTFAVERLDNRRIRRIRLTPVASATSTTAVSIVSLAGTSLIEPLQLALTL